MFVIYKIIRKKYLATGDWSQSNTCATFDFTKTDIEM